MTQVAERYETLSAALASIRDDASLSPTGLKHERSEAFGRFVARGYPTTRDEEWRFTSLAPLSALAFERPGTSSESAAAHAVVPGLKAGLSITLVNGRLTSPVPATLPAGVSVRTIRTATAGELMPARPDGRTVFVDLNTALFEDVVVLEIAAKAVVADPIVVTCVVVPGPRPVVVSPRLVIVAGEASQASVVEIHTETGNGEPVFVNAVVDVQVHDGAFLDHVKFQRQSASSFHLASTFVSTGRSGTFTSHAVTVGGRIARNDIVSVLAGEGAECTLNGLYVAGGDSLVDTHTTIDHAQAHCPSHEVYKGILTGRARAVFNGKIVVRQDAQKTDAKQTNKALLLTDDAQVNAKPQLEIFADDVKCTHGAAIGQLDEDALFYLKARGISAIDARNMLIHAFAGDVLNGVKDEAIRNAAMRRVEECLGLPA